MHEETTEPIQNAAQVIERAAQVDVRNVDMPVLMRSLLCSSRAYAFWRNAIRRNQLVPFLLIQ